MSFRQGRSRKAWQVTEMHNASVPALPAVRRGQALELRDFLRMLALAKAFLEQMGRAWAEHGKLECDHILESIIESKQESL